MKFPFDLFCFGGSVQSVFVCSCDCCVYLLYFHIDHSLANMLLKA